MTPPAAVAAPPDSAPAFEELRCPRCGYNLRGLPQPRCPECGLQFVWEELIAGARRQLESPLFEYRWARRPVRSFFGTLGRALLPPWLWVGTSAALPPRCGPLLALVPLMLLVYDVSLLLAEHVWLELSRYKLMGGRGLTWIGPWAASGPADYAWAVASYAFIGGLIWLVAQVFRQVLRPWHLRQDQLLRVVVLSWAALVGWRALTVWLLVAGDLIALGRRSTITDWTMQIHEALPLLALLVSLCTGLTLYLKFRGGWLLGFLACAAILILLPTLIFSYVRPWFDAWTAGVTAGWPQACRVVVYRLVRGIWG